MLKSIEGIYRRGKIELAEVPSNLSEETPVIVTFLEPHTVNLRTYGIERDQAEELRERLETFVEEWDSPEMKVYNNYDAAKARL